MAVRDVSAPVPMVMKRRDAGGARSFERGRCQCAFVTTGHGHVAVTVGPGHSSIAALAPGSAQAAKHCAEPGARWERATPAEAGMDAAKVADAVRYAIGQRPRSPCASIRHGCLVAEDALNPERVGMPWQSFSLAKSVVSMVFGRAWTLGPDRAGRPGRLAVPGGRRAARRAARAPPARR